MKVKLSASTKNMLGRVIITYKVDKEKGKWGNSEKEEIVHNTGHVSEKFDTASFPTGKQILPPPPSKSSFNAAKAQKAWEISEKATKKVEETSEASKKKDSEERTLGK